MCTDNFLMYEVIYLNYIDGFVDKYVERFINAIMKRQGKYVKW
jgi:hypothetical protein